MATAQCIPFPTETDAVLERFEVFLLARRGLAQTTVNLNVGFIRRALPVLGPNPSHDEVELYVARLRRAGASYATMSNTIKALRHFTAFLGRPLDLAYGRKPVAVLPPVLTEAEVAVLLATAPTLREKTILGLLAYSGVRNSELCALRVCDVDAANQLISVQRGKGSKGRTVCISGAVVDLVSRYLKERGGAPEALLFVTVRHGHPLAQQDLRKIVRVNARRAGLEKRVFPHLMRHSLATNMLHRGANPLSIKEQLGHAHITTTMIYLHASKDRLAAEYRMFAPSYL